MRNVWDRTSIEEGNECQQERWASKGVDCESETKHSLEKRENLSLSSIFFKNLSGNKKWKAKNPQCLLDLDTYQHQLPARVIGWCDVEKTEFKLSRMGNEANFAQKNGNYFWPPKKPKTWHAICFNEIEFLHFPVSNSLGQTKYCHKNFHLHHWLNPCLNKPMQQGAGKASSVFNTKMCLNASCIRSITSQFVKTGAYSIISALFVSQRKYRTYAIFNNQNQKNLNHAPKSRPIHREESSETHDDWRSNAEETVAAGLKEQEDEGKRHGTFGEFFTLLLLLLLHLTTLFCSFLGGLKGFMNRLTILPFQFHLFALISPQNCYHGCTNYKLILWIMTVNILQFKIYQV